MTFSLFSQPLVKYRKNICSSYTGPTRSLIHGLGIVVAKHHLKRAVDRNVVKRLVRESFRHHKESLKGLDIIVLLRSKCTPLDKTALREEIDNLWRQLIKSYKPVL